MKNRAIKKHRIWTGFILAAVIALLIGTSPSKSDVNNPTTCDENIDREIILMRNDWDKNIKAILEQEKPSSQKVGEAFESLRTYKCWLNYLCEAVQFSGNANAAELGNGQLSRTHIDVIPGCVYPESVEIPSTKIQYMPLCQVSGNESATQIQKNYTLCRSKIEIEFASQDNDPKSAKGSSDVRQKSSAFVSLESALKDDSHQQQGRVLATKLRGILSKMHGLEAHVVQLREYLERFDARLPCIIDQCN